LFFSFNNNPFALRIRKKAAAAMQIAVASVEFLYRVYHMTVTLYNVC